MKCPECGYNSFDHLESCKKCGNDLLGHKARFGLRRLFFPDRHSEPPAEEPAIETEQERPSQEPAPASDPADFGFGLMPEQEDSMGDPSGSPLDDHFGGEMSLETVEDLDFPPEATEPAPPSVAGAPMEEGSFEAEAEKPLDFDFAWDEEPPSASLETAAGGFKVEPDSLEEGLPDWDDSDDGPGKEVGLDDLSAPLTDADFISEEDSHGDQSPEKDEMLSQEGESRNAEPPQEENLAKIFLDSLNETAVSDQFSADDISFSESLPAFGEDPFGEDPFLSSVEVAETGAGPAELSGGKTDEDESAIPVEAEDGVEESKDAELTDFEGDMHPPLIARFGAGVADLIILLLVFVLFVAAGQMALSTNRGGGIFPTAQTLLELAIPYFLVLFAVFFGYFTLFHFFIGQTPGKMLFRLRVEGAQGGGLLFSQAFLRSVGGLLSLLPAGLGYLRIALDRERRGWNDCLANSRVVRVAGWRDFEETAEGVLPEEI